MTAGLLLLAGSWAGLALAGCQPPKAQADDAAAPPAPVAVGTVARTMVPRILDLQATVVPDPAHVSQVSTTVSQPVLAVHVRVGDRVTRGEPLVELASDPQARANEQQAEIALATARRAAMREAALVAGGVDPRVNLEQARAALAIAQAQASSAKQLLARTTAATHIVAPMAGVVTQVSAAIGQVTIPGATLVQIADPQRLMANIQVEPQDLGKVQAGESVALTTPGASASFHATVVRVAATVDPTTQLGEADAAIAPMANAPSIGRFLTAVVHLGAAPALVVPAAALIHRDDGDKVYVMVPSSVSAGPSGTETSASRTLGTKTRGASEGPARPLESLPAKPEGGHSEGVKGVAHEVPVVRGIAFDGEYAVQGALEPGMTVVTTGAYELSDGESVVADAAASASAGSAK